ncbi:TrpB-like pyridoxal phosphate-dependent enzyme [Sanyastnella coralliicola]|uniref:TrpB-like pyridoxal phosphate-dependent enzyme n=1 Tax=Sanyastnella coralliicola TaxID=3069118 RepID=UPI0027B9B060|nr:TrpB-like pyridoxal phosphate-dependent enzyme [Longitalea sp. SCSIO 12813]
MMKNRRFDLLPQEVPTHFYNIVADMPNKPLPPLNPGTMEPIGPEALAPLFPEELIKQEVSAEQMIEIPDEVRDTYLKYRPTPLFRAFELEKALDTPAKIYYKYEGVSPSGSHKPNTAIAQAYYNKMEGVKKITTETGAGQWGSALSFACAQFNIDCEVFMVRISHDQKPYRKMLMQTYGADVHASPTNTTEAGRKILAEDPDSPGSLGIAISEAVEKAANDPDTKYALGSVLNHVLLHQTVIGQEAIKQMEKAGEMPDIICAPFGGGSNFAGISFPFLRMNFTQGRKIRCIASEPSSCPKLTKGEFRYDFGDTVGMTPLMPMYTLGHQFVPAPIHAGGLRYHGAGVVVSQLLKDKLIEAEAIDQLECFEAGVLFTQKEGILPAPETCHAIASAIREAKKCKESGESKVILIHLCGHGYFDLKAYDDYLKGSLVKHELSDADVQKALQKIQTPSLV